MVQAEEEETGWKEAQCTGRLEGPGEHRITSQHTAMLASHGHLVPSIMGAARQLPEYPSAEQHSILWPSHSQEGLLTENYDGPLGFLRGRRFPPPND